MADDCVFCRIIRKELPAKFVHESPESVAIRDINPQAPTHIVVIPRAHIPSLNEATDAAVIGGLSLVAAEIARQEGIADSGYRTVINTNRDGGQTVSHIHLHLLGGRRMSWPPG